MFRDIKDLLAYEIRTKPHLKAIEDQLDDLSLEDLSRMSFPLKWIRDAFLKKKTDRLETIRVEQMTKMIEEQTGSLESSGAFVDGKTADPQGAIVQWLGADEEFLRIDRGGQINVRYGHYLFMPLNGGIFHDNLFSQHIDPKVFQSGRPTSQGTLSEYKRLRAEARNKNVPAGAPVIDLTPADTGPMGRLGALGVRFS